MCEYQYNDRRSGPPASPPVSFNIHKYKSIPYHYTLLTCVTVVVRTTTVLTRPHTHSLNTTLQKTRRTHRHTHYDKHGTRHSIIFSLCCSRMQKQRAQKDEVVVGPGLERMHWDKFGAGFTQKEPSSSSRTSSSVKPVASTSASLPSTTLHQQPASSCSYSTTFPSGCSARATRASSPASSKTYMLGRLVEGWTAMY